MKASQATYDELLVTDNLRLVHHFARKFYNTNYEYEELYSIGCLGLVKAAISFSPDKSMNYSAYASRCIENEILMSFRKVNKKIENEVSINTVIGFGADGKEETYEDILPSESNLEDYLFGKAINEEVSRLLDTLPERTKQMIMMQYGIGTGKPLPQSEIARHFGCIQTNVSRIVIRAMKKLKNENSIDDFYTLIG